jgi:hypothetical protein
MMPRRALRAGFALLAAVADRAVRSMTAFEQSDRLVRVDSVEKLLFRNYSKNSRFVETSLLLGRGGPSDLLSIATSGP